MKSWSSISPARQYLDDSAAMVIEQILDVARHADTDVIVVGLSGTVAEMINTLGVLRAVPGDHVVEDHGTGAPHCPRRLLGD